MVKKTERPTLTKRLLIAVGIFIALLIVSSFAALFFGSDDFTGGNTAVIKITGPIISSDGSGIFGEGYTTSTDIVALLEQAADDSSITGIILEINSPGGSAVASDEIAQAVLNVKKPVASWVREVGASGAYWIASSSDHIVANRMSITGSIGVYSSYLGFSEFLEEWNVTHNRLVAGDRKDLGNPFQELSQQDKLFLQKKIDKIHDIFIKEVSLNRNMSTAEVRALADGSFYLGVEALENGLIDELGGKEETILYVENVTGETASLVVFEDEPTLFELLGVFSRQRPATVEDFARQEMLASIPMLQ